MYTDAIQEKILDGIEQLAHALNEQSAANTEYGIAEHAYRQARAEQFIKVSLEKDDNGKKLTDPHKNAVVDLATDKAMLRVRLAEANRETSQELVRSLRAQISALQSLLNAQRAEAEAVTYAQSIGA